jgi:hypothetical protein
MKYFWLSIILVLGLFAQACKEDEDRVWVTIDPIQCMGNSWEQDWLENNNSDYKLYSNYTDAEELQIFKQYFEKLGIKIYKLDQTFPYNGTCDACNCPRGDSYHCFIDGKNTNQMLSYGFKVQ